MVKSIFGGVSAAIIVYISLHFLLKCQLPVVTESQNKPDYPDKDFVAGLDAYKAGKFPHDNPHTMGDGTGRFQAWDHGFDFAHRRGFDRQRQDNVEAFKRGIEAFKVGKPFKDNPYEDGEKITVLKPGWRSWNQGWKWAKENK